MSSTTASANSNANNTTSAAAASGADVVLITGATRGIGLGLVERFAEAGHTVIATARNVAKADQLNAVVKRFPTRVHVVALDVDDAKSVAALPAAVAALKFTHIDVLINNSGVMSAKGPHETLENGERSDFLAVFNTNVLGAWDVSRVLLPLLRKSKAPRLVNVSSFVGSITSTNDAVMLAGHMAAYRLSKSALNHLSAIQSAEYNEAAVKALAAGGESAKAAAPLVTVLALNPGAVDTDMATEFKKAGVPMITPLQSTSGLLKVIATAKPNAKAQFLSFDGTALQW